jgi:hypothetical protein
LHNHDRDALAPCLILRRVISASGTFQTCRSSLQRDFVVEGVPPSVLAVAADHRGLDCGAVVEQNKTRYDPRMRKVNVLNALACIRHHIAALQFDAPEMGIDLICPSGVNAGQQRVL